MPRKPRRLPLLLNGGRVRDEQRSLEWQVIANLKTNSMY
jgi:hypothetical protein